MFILDVGEFVSLFLGGRGGHNVFIVSNRPLPPPQHTRLNDLNLTGPLLPCSSLPVPPSILFGNDKKRVTKTPQSFMLGVCVCEREREDMRVKGGGKYDIMIIDCLGCS